MPSIQLSCFRKIITLISMTYDTLTKHEKTHTINVSLSMHLVIYIWDMYMCISTLGQHVME